ncbi:MAG TPA: nuclear transport factor 2 family protein [Mucilaginibacter sp.]|nr:nuclear transport factor 2 family protein [Mucilaginibacter sp.]
MISISLKSSLNRILLFLLFLSAFAIPVKAQRSDAKAKAAIISAMENSENDWNKGDLGNYMKMYTDSSTMMMPTGPAGLSVIKDLYEKKYFNGKMPKQNLHYSELKVTLLGKNYALLTGKFTLSGNNLPERSGRYSLVMVHTNDGWKILHDHSG